MKQEDKELLLKDLCSRLPYSVIVRHADYLVDSDGNYTGQFWYKRGYLYDICRMDDMTTTIIESEGSDEEGYEHICDLERSLPYLRPMSSMTEEEKKEISILLNYEFYIDDDYALVAEDDRHRIRLDLMKVYINWLNKHHFDYNELIEKGLAIEVTEENNPYK